jgi:hypothetical protein
MRPSQGELACLLRYLIKNSPPLPPPTPLQELSNIVCDAGSRYQARGAHPHHGSQEARAPAATVLEARAFQIAQDPAAPGTLLLHGNAHAHMRAHTHARACSHAQANAQTVSQKPQPLNQKPETGHPRPQAPGLNPHTLNPDEPYRYSGRSSARARLCRTGLCS